MNRLSDALDACEIPYRYGGWYPAKPPKPPYAVVLDQRESVGADLKILAINHSPTIEIYTDVAGGKANDPITSLSHELIRGNVKFEVFEPVYIYTEKLYQIVFDIEDIYEKL